MKTITLNTIAIGKKMVITLLMVVFTLSVATANTGDSTIINENVSVSCLKVAEGQIFFNVKFENADGGRFHLLVNDACRSQKEYGTEELKRKHCLPKVTFTSLHRDFSLDDFCCF